MERELRRYQRVAYQEHFCDRCCNCIHPGDIYEGRIVTDKGRFLVWKTHISPSCDYPEEPKESKDLEKIIRSKEELKHAA